jgi:hypothetical protein
LLIAASPFHRLLICYRMVAHRLLKCNRLVAPRSAKSVEPAGPGWFRGTVRVSFDKTGPRRYGVTVERRHAADVAMHPAPGYDDWLPHDLIHFLVEREVGLRDGIFGQLAAGGDAHTFVPTDEQRTRRWARRSERRNAGSGSQIERSERVAFAVHNEWNFRAGRHRSRLPRDPQTEADVQAVLPALDDAAQAWHALAVHGSLAFTWPWPERGERRAARRSTAAKPPIH